MRRETETKIITSKSIRIRLDDNINTDYNLQYMYIRYY
jgi:hypothetical protein